MPAASRTLFEALWPVFGRGGAAGLRPLCAWRPVSRRRGDLIRAALLRLLTAAFGTPRDASLRRTDWVAIRGIADMPGALRTARCDAIDPTET
jgi:hypothetical protein